MEASIFDFYQQLYIHSIYKLAFYLPRVRILGTHNCGNILREAFKSQAAYQDLLCHRYYSELVVASFVHQIQL